MYLSDKNLEYARGKFLEASSRLLPGNVGCVTLDMNENLNWYWEEATVGVSGKVESVMEHRIPGFVDFFVPYARTFLITK